MPAQTPATPATSARYPSVSSQARQQPDLYAAAFTRELLTQDYRTSRDQLLAWVLGNGPVHRALGRGTDPGRAAGKVGTLVGPRTTPGVQQ